jgi:hypothetical protein
MHQPDEINRQASNTGKNLGAKKPYQRPTVRFERVFETSAISCGKVQVNEGPCHTNRKVS